MNETTKRYLIIGVAIFCLLVFSISAPVMGFFTQLFISNRLGSIVMPNGEKIAIEIEDSALAQSLSNLQLQGGSALAPFAWLSNSAAIGQGEHVKAVMILRRAAIAAGIDVSDDDVSQAIEVGKKLRLQANPELKAEDFNPLHYLGPRSRVTSVAELELLVREAIRISNYVYLEIMGGMEAGDAVLSEFVRKDRETLLLSYASWATKPLIEEYKKKPPSDKDLLEWVANLEDAERKRPLVDDVHVAWNLVYADYKQLDPKPLSAWIKDMAPIGDAEVEQYYDQNKDQLYIKEVKAPDESGKKEAGKPEAGKEGANKKEPGDPDANKKGSDTEGTKTPEGKKQDEHGGLLQDGAAASADKPGEAEGTTLQDGVTPPDASAGGLPIPPQQGPDYIPLEQVKDQIRRRLEVQQLLEAIRRKALDAYTASLAAKREKEEEKAAKEKAAKEGKEGKEGKAGKKETVGPAKKFEEFVLKTWLADQFEAGKLPKGLLFVSIPKAARPESFREGSPYGVWEATNKLREVFGKGELGTDVQMAQNGAFFFQLTDRIEDVVRPIEEIRTEAQEIHAKQKAVDEMKEKAEAFRKLVRTQAEGLLAEEVAKMRKACREKIDGDFDAWKKKLESMIADTEKEIAAGGLPARSIARRKTNIQAWNDELSKADDKKAEIKKTEEDLLEIELKKKLKPKMAEAFGLALKEQGIEVQQLGPFTKDASQTARFSLLEDGAEKFLEADTTLLAAKEGWVSDVMEEAVEQTYYVVRLDERKEGGMDLVTRRSMAERRIRFSTERFDSILKNAYSPEAVIARFKYKSTETGAVGTSSDRKDEDPKKAGSKKADPKNADPKKADPKKADPKKN